MMKAASNVALFIFPSIGHWIQLNMDRCIDLEDRGLMTPAGISENADVHSLGKNRVNATLRNVPS